MPLLFRRYQSDRSRTDLGPACHARSRLNQLRYPLISRARHTLPAMAAVTVLHERQSGLLEQVLKGHRARHADPTCRFSTEGWTQKHIVQAAKKRVPTQRRSLRPAGGQGTTRPVPCSALSVFSPGPRPQVVVKAWPAGCSWKDYGPRVSVLRTTLRAIGSRSESQVVWSSKLLTSSIGLARRPKK